ncbi:MAG: alpha/beta fold hydrolase [Pirellulaceae bacterium]|nr:alpha/beta fold hydrolase [Pirellulaceae bacterium]
MRYAMLVFLSIHCTVCFAEDALPRRAVLGLPFTAVPQGRATELKLKPDEGLLAKTPAPGLTAAQAGVVEGDIVLALNGKPVGMSSVAAVVREILSGQELAISIVRDGKSIELKSTAIEKPRDPGNSNFEVVYSHVVSNGLRMRTIITKPKSPGKHPALMFIQGFSPVSYDYKLEGSKGDVATIDGPLLFEFANSGFVTLRVEKPGVGDSEGGPFADLDYTTELDIYRQALKQLKGLDEVDANNVFIFGHSMGGAFGPMIASEDPVKGIAVYGAAARTWYEYLLDTLRYQGLVAGDSFENTDEKVRLGSRLLALVFLENKSVDEIKKMHPELTDMADALLPGGLFSGKSLEFWRQLGQTNFPAYWSKCDAHVLAVRGASDFVTYDVDHKLIADVVNASHPGRGKSLTLPDSDHLFHNFSTEQKSMQNFQRGEFNIAFAKLLKGWIEEVSGSK